MLAIVLAAALVPASAEAVIAVEDVSGLRALLTTAAKHTPSLAPEQIGVSLRQSVGVNLFADDPRWGLAPRGARQLVFIHGATGLSAPVADAKAARKMLGSWISSGPDRAGRVVSGRLLTASGRAAATLLTSMAKPAPLARDLAARATGPAWIWIRLAEPLRSAVLVLDANGGGVTARGLVTASSPILAGRAPSCPEAMSCLAAGLGPAGRGALAAFLDRLGVAPQAGLRSAARVVEVLEAIDVRHLSDERSLGTALHVTAEFEAPPAAAAALAAQLDLAQVDASLARLSPLDALRGPLAGRAVAAHLVYGALLRNAGPLTLSGSAARGNAAEVELRLPVR